MIDIKVGEKLLAENILEYEKFKEKYQFELKKLSEALRLLAPDKYKKVVFDEAWAKKYLKKNRLAFWRK